MEKYFKTIINAGLEEGNLELIPLLGLRSPLVLVILQKYVDNTGDIQTAAYISSYIHSMAKVNNVTPPPVTKKYLQEYRNFLNQLQLWNVRAEFDVSLGQLQNSPIFINYSALVKPSKQSAAAAAGGLGSNGSLSIT